jgi:hypothetical protein
VRGTEDRRRHLVGEAAERVRDDLPLDRGVVPTRPARDRRVLEQERAGALVDADAPARRDDDRRVVLVDEQRPGCRRGQRGAWPHRHVDRAVAEVRKTPRAPPPE